MGTSTPSIPRRQFLQAGAALAATSALPLAAAAEEWQAGEVVHLLPTANHERILLKASFRSPLATVSCVAPSSTG